MEAFEKRPNKAKARQSIAHMPASSLLGADERNATIDLSATQRSLDAIKQASKKRSRGKSLGPGGLEALKETNGNTTKIAQLLQPKSILKPTMPLTPPKSIPSFAELRQRSTRKKSPVKPNTEALLIDFSTPAPSREDESSAATALPQTFDPFSPLKPKEMNGNSHHVEANEEDHLRQEQKRYVLEQRAARRKSMANRRVSFAPEATLHTWSVMEMLEESTTSSASNSTRRQSSITAQQTPQREASTESEPSMPDPQLPRPDAEVGQEIPSSAQQNDLSKKRRRSSMMSELNVPGDEMYSSSPSGDVMAESSPIRVEDSIASDSDTDGDTAMSMDEMTQTTIHSQESASSTHSSLEERLRQASTQAGTRGIEYDEFGDDVSMEIAADTVTNAFHPWARGQQQQEPTQSEAHIDPFSPAKKAEALKATNMQADGDATQEMTMEITRAVGGILSGSPSHRRRRSVSSKRKSTSGRRQSLAADSSYGDESMELTTVAGRILSSKDQTEGDEDIASEDVTMEFTSAVGGLLGRRLRESVQSMASDENETMEITTAVGGILAPMEEHTELEHDVEEDGTVAMDMTRAVGHILDGSITETHEPHELHETNNNLSNSGSSLQVDEELVASTPRQVARTASDTGSPSLATKPRSSGRTRAALASQASTKSSPTNTTPRRILLTKQETPTKQMTPIPAKAKTPERTPISTGITHRGASPRRLFQAEIQAKASPASTKKTSRQQDPLFAQDEMTGRQTPRVVLHAPKPHQHLGRRSSGIGIDKEGYGSPSVTKLLARRSSIGDTAAHFKLDFSQRTQRRIENPQQLADEVDAERADEERRESGRFVMEQEANGLQEENVTLQLKDMIESMTPKKSTLSRFKGRKSLAVGSARGLLGKRPLELDDEDDDSPKRLKAVSREASPVKKVHLPKPPSMEQTTGRLTRLEQKALDAAGAHTPTLIQSPVCTASSPPQSQRYRDCADNAADRPASFEDKLDNVVDALDPSIEYPTATRANLDEDKISLQEFLNMTNIHFIELNTTKRRHTIAQATKDSGEGHQTQLNTIEECFVAAATTLPLLELYQHAARELKSYISTGRKIIRSIEAETLVEQPSLFREYIDARPDVKLIMDNQFRNGKTNARLQGKEGWYTWRSQLVDGLQTGLSSVQNDMENDLLVVETQAAVVANSIPRLESRYKEYTHELTSLQKRLSELEGINHLELRAGRQDLKSTNAGLREKQALLQSLQQQMQEKDEALLSAAEIRDEMQEQISEANRVREELRGWAVKDVLVLKSEVDAIRKQFGWILVSAEEDLDEPSNFGIALTMTYRDAMRLFFYPSAFDQATDKSHRRSLRNSRSASEPTAPISLTYAPTPEDLLSELPTEQRFFLQLMQSQLHAFAAMPKGSVTTKTLLSTVSSGWELACKISAEIRLLEFAGVTRVSIVSDDKLSIRLMLVLSDQGRVDIVFTLLVATSTSGEISTTTDVHASAVYGRIAALLDVSKARRVQAALSKEVEGKVLGTGAYIGAVQGFEKWHHSQKDTQREAEIDVKPADVETGEESTAGSTTPRSPAPAKLKTPAARRSPLTVKKVNAVQKKTIPIPTSRQDKFRSSQREQQPLMEKPPALSSDTVKDKENLDPFTYSSSLKGPAITPEMQEAMMQRTPIKRVGALRRSPI